MLRRALLLALALALASGCIDDGGGNGTGTDEPLAGSCLVTNANSALPMQCMEYFTADSSLIEDARSHCGDNAAETWQAGACDTSEAYAICTTTDPLRTRTYYLPGYNATAAQVESHCSREGGVFEAPEAPEE